MSEHGPLDHLEATAVTECQAARDLMHLRRNEVSISASLERTRTDIIKKNGEHQVLLASALRARGVELKQGQTVEVRRRPADGRVVLFVVDPPLPEPPKQTSAEVEALARIKVLEQDLEKARAERDAAVRDREVVARKLAEHEAHFGRMILPTLASMSEAPKPPPQPSAPVPSQQSAPQQSAPQQPAPQPSAVQPAPPPPEPDLPPGAKACEYRGKACAKAAVCDVTLTIIEGVASTVPMCEPCADVVHLKANQGADGSPAELLRVESFYFDPPSWADDGLDADDEPIVLEEPEDAPDIGEEGHPAADEGPDAAKD